MIIIIIIIIITHPTTDPSTMFKERAGTIRAHQLLLLLLLIAYKAPKKTAVEEIRKGEQVYGTIVSSEMTDQSIDCLD